MSTLSVFGASGFIGSAYCSKYDKTIPVEKNSLTCSSSSILYFISTVDNYNVFNNPFIDVETNLLHLLKVLDVNKHTCKEFNFISSWFVYGSQETLPVPETAHCDPKGFYSITKRTAEQLLISYCSTYNIPYRILRLGNVYGKGDFKASKKKNALQYLVNEIKQEKNIELYYGGDFYRDYIFIEDCISAIYTVVTNGNLNEVYNIGNQEKVKFIEIINKVIENTGSKSKINNITPSQFHLNVQVKDILLNSNKLFSLGYTPKFKITENIKNII